MWKPLVFDSDSEEAEYVTHEMFELYKYWLERNDNRYLLIKV